MKTRNTTGAFHEIFGPSRLVDFAKPSHQKLRFATGIPNIMVGPEKSKWSENTSKGPEANPKSES
jgi:hypothetical protein